MVFDSTLQVMDRTSPRSSPAFASLLLTLILDGGSAIFSISTNETIDYAGGR
jgi:hypothetical protein